MENEMFLHLLIGPLLLLFSIIYYYFPPKNINALYGHRTNMSMKNQDTWNEANKRSTKSMFWSSTYTCIIQITGIILGFNNEKLILYSTIFLVASLVIGVIKVENQLKNIFDKDGNRI
ncbi:MAG: SdpI family protein [Flavobacteriales bacterium]